MTFGHLVRLALGTAALAPALWAQEASSGIDLRATVTGEGFYSGELRRSPRDGSSLAGGVRSILYPTLKLGEHWSATGAIEATSRPYDPQEFYRAGNGIRGRVLQATLGYSKVGRNASVLIRAGQLPTAFGSFMLRYDDADNPVVSAPSAYGYYYNPVTSLGLAGVQADVTWRKWDARLQFASSSPANPRSIFDKDQYANWAGGAGYTIRQGLRVGVSAYRGPYLDRHYPYYFPGEAAPHNLPATGVGFDVDWATGHWNIRGEWQSFLMAYRAIPDFRESGGYAEVKRVLSPRWFAAGRTGYLNSNVLSGESTFEGAVGFRPNRFQLLKAGYLVTRAQRNGTVDKAVVVQVVTSVHPLSMAWH